MKNKYLKNHSILLFIILGAGVMSILFFLLNPFPLSNLQADMYKILEENKVKTSDLNLPEIKSQEGAGEKVNTIVYSVIEIVLALSGMIAVVFLVIGGARYTMSAGDEDMINGAKSMILYAISGLLVVIFSYLLLSNLISILERGEGK